MSLRDKQIERRKNPLALLSFRDNHPNTATAKHHPVCRAPLIQIVAP
jgi:hypothetical protein